jgi:phytoene dehydrogenase-like protein
MAVQAALDAVVVGAGPNGLAAAVQLARAGHSVRIYEAAADVGGGSRTAELTLPGFRHDICSTVHPLLMASPFFRSLDLGALGIEIAHPEVPLAHPVADGRAAAMYRTLDQTVDGLGVDGAAYEKLMRPHLSRAGKLMPELLGPLRVPRHPLLMARFGLDGFRSAAGLARSRFASEAARGLFTGVAAHSMLPMERALTGGVGLLLSILAHWVGWPFVRGGSQAIADGLAELLRSLGGEIVTDHPVEQIDELPSARAYLFDVTPTQLVAIAGDRLPDRYKRRLKGFRHGPGVFKVDWALSDPVPWQAEVCRRAGTVHLGWSLDAIARSEADANQGRHNETPFVIVTQPGAADPTRAPEGKHVLWAYCHVPSGSTLDMSGVIEAQIERFAPGFKDTILARSAWDSADFERYNPNYIGGDINGGVQDVGQHFARPVARLSPHSTPVKDIYLCSSSTPPGGGVHGMCGWFAAKAALRRAL